jgi:hypothetical protein
MKQKELESLLGSIIAGDYPGSILNEYKYKDPADYSSNLTLDYSYTAKGILKKIGDYFIMTLPVKYDFNYVNLPERKFPVEFQTTDGDVHTITVTIPDGYEIKGLPESLNIKNKHFFYTSDYKIVGNKIFFTDHLERISIYVPVSEYKEFREQILKIDYFIKSPIVIKKK